MRDSDSNLTKYQAKLDELIAEDSPAIFANYSRAHAHCIIRAFLTDAQKSVDILAGDFGNDFYRDPSIRSAVLKAASNGAHIRIISLCTSEESKEYVRNLAEESNRRGGEFLYVFARVRPGTQVKHYMIVDRKRYRLEDYHDEGAAIVHGDAS